MMKKWIKMKTTRRETSGKSVIEDKGIPTYRAFNFSRLSRLVICNSPVLAAYTIRPSLFESNDSPAKILLALFQVSSPCDSPLVRVIKVSRTGAVGDTLVRRSLHDFRHKVRFL